MAGSELHPEPCTLIPETRHPTPDTLHPMSTTYHIHPEHPQMLKIEKAVAELRRGALMLYPTDTVWAIGCDIGNKAGVERIRSLKKLTTDRPLTFLCHSLTNIAEYAHIADGAYRVIKHLIPGPYTFILPATKLVPRLVMSPKRKTTGIRVPDHRICRALLETLGNPIVSMSAAIQFNSPVESAEELLRNYEKLVDVIIDDGSPYRTAVSTVIDMSGEEFRVAREGLGLEKALQYL